MRDRIISEIKKLAAMNGGRPPGKRAFLRETGIRRSDWSGRFWARWGDALREAGFKPNELQPKAEQEFLLQKLAEAFRHYGKVPTAVELRMYCQSNSTFPSHNTFYNYFASKEEMIIHLREWLVKVGGYDDVVAILPAKEVVSAPRMPRTTSKDGSVYLLRSGTYYKIGRSDEIERRIKEIRVALPEATSLEHHILTDDPSGIEAYWHKRFADRRLNGEWFKLSPADVLAFKRRKFQ